MNGDFFSRLGEIHAEAAGGGREQEFISACVETLALAALDYGVDGYSDLSDDDTDAIAAHVERKIHALLQSEVAKINGT